MYTLSVAIDVNPPGVTPRLSQEQVWRGLMIKAENAVLFVPRTHWRSVCGARGCSSGSGAFQVTSMNGRYSRARRRWNMVDCPGLSERICRHRSRMRKQKYTFKSMFTRRRKFTRMGFSWRL